MREITYPVSLIERQIENARIRMKYPEVQGLGSQELQRKINEKIQDVVYKTIWNQGFEREPRLFVTGNTQTALNKAGILSIVLKMRFGIREVATEFWKVKAITFDLQNGDMYKFEDLFKDDSDYIDRINKAIKRQIIERDIPLLKKFKTIERDQRFYLTPDALIVYFPSNEYTPDSFEILEFSIPYSVLNDLAYEKGPLVRLESQKVEISENANGKALELLRGQSLELSLITNPSTGYTWQYVQEPNPIVLKETRHYLIAQGRNPGSPSIEYWIYIPTGTGTTSIALKYSRSWSKEPPIKTFRVNITVS